MPDAYFHPGNGFELRLAGCPASANADGCGGLSKEKHALRSVGGEPELLADLGRVYGDGSGGYTVATTEEHALRCATGEPQLCQSHPGLVYADVSGGYTVATTEEHALHSATGQPQLCQSHPGLVYADVSGG